MQKKASDVVVVRVSEQGDRDEENFHSPKAQLARAKLWSKDEGNRVVDAFEEIDVSGKLPLARRPGLLKAIEMVEAGEADHIVVAYFDRLVRSLKAQLEVIERVEQAGGEIYAIDHGRLTNGTAGDADEQKHDGCGVSVLRRGDRREGRSRPGAGGGARGAAQLEDLARLRARCGRRAGRGARQGPDRRAGVQAP